LRYGEITMKMKPLEDRLLVKVTAVDAMTPGGIMIPTDSADAPDTGLVVEAGLGRMLETGKRTKMMVKKGDTVLFSIHQGSDVEIEGEKYKILHESDIMGIMEPEDA